MTRPPRAKRSRHAVRIRTGVGYQSATGLWHVLQERAGQLLVSEKGFATEAEAEVAARRVIEELHGSLEERGIEFVPHTEETTDG